MMMTFNEKGQKKTYISTFRFELKPPLDEPRRTENRGKLKHREESRLKSGKSARERFLHITKTVLGVI